MIRPLLAEQISGKLQAERELNRAKVVSTVPRSWSLCGRCSGRSGGTFLTSDFLSTGQSLQVSVSLSEHKHTGEERSNDGTVPVVCLAEGALGGGGFFGLWKHTQTQTHHKNTSRISRIFATVWVSNVTVNI